MTAVAGVLIARGVLDITVLAPATAGPWGGTATAWYAGGAAAAALLATGLVHLLLLSTPRPMRFFAWAMVLATVIAVFVPMVADAALAARLAVAALNLILGIAIGSLVSGTAASAVRGGRRPDADQFYQRQE
jgi:hypothetical protein